MILTARCLIWQLDGKSGREGERGRGEGMERGREGGGGGGERERERGWREGERERENCCLSPIVITNMVNMPHYNVPTLVYTQSRLLPVGYPHIPHTHTHTHTHVHTHTTHTTIQSTTRSTI